MDWAVRDEYPGQSYARSSDGCWPGHTCPPDAEAKAIELEDRTLNAA